MATSTILHVGNDTCQRIPVMQRAGFIVVQSPESISAIRGVLLGQQALSAVIFHSDYSAPAEPILRESRRLSAAPLVLFQNPTITCIEESFDLVIPVLTPPAIWLKKLKEVIEVSRDICEQSRLLRKDCAALRFESRALRAASARNRQLPINPDALWHGETGDAADAQSPGDPGKQDAKD